MPFQGLGGGECPGEQAETHGDLPSPHAAPQPPRRRAGRVFPSQFSLENNCAPNAAQGTRVTKNNSQQRHTHVTVSIRLPLLFGTDRSLSGGCTAPAWRTKCAGPAALHSTAFPGRTRYRGDIKASGASSGLSQQDKQLRTTAREDMTRLY